MIPNTIPAWVLTGQSPPVNPVEVWPEDVLSEDEWDAAWLDRRIAAGKTPIWICACSKQFPTETDWTTHSAASGCSAYRIEPL